MSQSFVSRSSDRHRLPRIGITVGDPAGIGPEISLKAVADQRILEDCNPVLVGDARHLKSLAQRLAIPFNLTLITKGSGIPDELSGGALYSLDNLAGEIEMGVESPVTGRASAEYIELAARLCLTGELDAITTAPISKKALSLAGYRFPGHTEFLADLAKCDDFAMAFVAPTLRVALLTIHVPLADVPSLVKKDDLARLIRLVDRELKKYGLARPRIAVAAINPHAGEGGLFGDEEAREMRPAIEACRASGEIDVTGPYPGDTVFVRASRGEFDLVISCYHDQGLIPIKCLSFNEAVNVTLGLPFIRTSVDHGTAFDIAGKGTANPASMIAAIRLAIDFCNKRT